MEHVIFLQVAAAYVDTILSNRLCTNVWAVQGE